MDCSPPGSSVRGDSPGKNTGVGHHALLQGIFSKGSNPCLLCLLYLAGRFFTSSASCEALLRTHIHAIISKVSRLSSFLKNHKNNYFLNTIGRLMIFRCLNSFKRNSTLPLNLSTSKKLKTKCHLENFFSNIL